MGEQSNVIRWPGCLFAACLFVLFAGANQAAAQLDSHDRVQVQQALEEMALSGDPDHVQAISTRIQQGMPRGLLMQAIETLGLIGDPSAGPTLIALARHRVPAVRTAAIHALVGCRVEGASEVLQRAVHDLDPAVRAAAALALGQLGDRSAVPLLFRALDRNIVEAAPSLGHLVRGEEIQQLMGYLGRVQFDAMTPALNELFARDDINQRQKLNLVAQLQELGTGAARTFLEDLIALMPPGGRDEPIRRAAMDAAMRISE